MKEETDYILYLTDSAETEKGIVAEKTGCKDKEIFRSSIIKEDTEYMCDFEFCGTNNVFIELIAIENNETEYRFPSIICR